MAPFWTRRYSVGSGRVKVPPPSSLHRDTGWHQAEGLVLYKILIHTPRPTDQLDSVLEFAQSHEITQLLQRGTTFWSIVPSCAELCRVAFDSFSLCV